MHVGRTLFHITQNIATLNIGKDCVLFADRLDSQRVIVTVRLCFALFSANLSHDLLVLVDFPADQIMEDLREFLMTLSGALPLNLEIIERCGMVAGRFRVNVIVPSLMP